LTLFSDINQLALVSIRDYKIDKLFTTNDIATFESQMKGYLLKAIPKFTNCKYDLDSITDITNSQFTNDLSLTEQTILSDLQVIEWLNSKILDITQLNLHLNDTDFKRYSEAQNLTAKMNTRNILRETINQDMENYSIKNIPWSDWMSGNYG
jgi:hypothetical protein